MLSTALFTSYRLLLGKSGERSNGLIKNMEEKGVNIWIS
tara:strand:- start:302 stop:418 length:117 start_codon:yes stop_codon:yes gene_type:complete